MESLPIFRFNFSISKIHEPMYASRDHPPVSVMCNRVRASFEFRETKLRSNLFNDLPEFKPSNNVAPDCRGNLSILHSDAGNEGQLMYWPLIPSFAKELKLSYSTTNATAKRLLESPVYKRLLDKRRCLIPINSSTQSIRNGIGKNVKGGRAISPGNLPSY
jgi:SOS response associated peptidase (SRAP)